MGEAKRRRAKDPSYGKNPNHGLKKAKKAYLPIYEFLISKEFKPASRLKIGKTEKTCLSIFLSEEWEGCSDLALVDFWSPGSADVAFGYLGELEWDFPGQVEELIFDFSQSQKRSIVFWYPCDPGRRSMYSLLGLSEKLWQEEENLFLPPHFHLDTPINKKGA